MNEEENKDLQSEIDAEFLNEIRKVLDYNPETGLLKWKVDVGRKVKAGSLAGTVNERGRLRIRFRNNNYYAHRLAWLITYGKWPEQMVDHIDGDPLNNRIDNLRDVSRSINMQNQRKAMSNNKSGFLGVCWDKHSRKFQAGIQTDGKRKSLGLFTSEELAYRAYLAAKRELHKGNTL